MIAIADGFRISLSIVFLREQAIEILAWLGFLGSNAP